MLNRLKMATIAEIKSDVVLITESNKFSDHKENPYYYYIGKRQADSSAKEAIKDNRKSYKVPSLAHVNVRISPLK